MQQAGDVIDDAIEYVEDDKLRYFCTNLHWSAAFVSCAGIRA